jgi:hypothetical protein
MHGLAHTIRVAALAGVTALALASLSSIPAGASGPTTTQAKQALLTIHDMPAGWKPTKSTNGGNNNFPGVKQLASCIGASSSVLGANPPQVNSPDFHSKDQSLEVDDSVSIFKSKKFGALEFTTISNPKVPTCMASLMNGPLKSQLEASGGSGASIGTISVTHATSPKGTAAFTVVLPLSAHGASLTVSLTLVYMVKGQLGQQISFSGYGGSFPASLENHITTVALNRL